MKASTALTDKRYFWQQHVLQAQRHSGSLADYAKQHQLKANTLYYWVNLFNRPPQPSASADEPVGFSAVQVVSTAPTAEYVIQLSSRLALRCSVLPDAQWLAALCRQLDRPT